MMMAAHQQRLAELRFELADLPAHRALRDVQHFRGTCEVAGVSGYLESPQRIEGGHFSLQDDLLFAAGGGSGTRRAFDTQVHRSMPFFDGILRIEANYAASATRTRAAKL